MDIPRRSLACDSESCKRWHTEFRETERPDIGSSVLAKFVLRATAPSMSKFVPLTLSMEDENQLENAYNVSLCLDELQTTLLRKKCSMFSPSCFLWIQNQAKKIQSPRISLCSTPFQG